MWLTSARAGHAYIIRGQAPSKSNNKRSCGGVPSLAKDLHNTSTEVIPGVSEFGNRYSREFKLKVLKESESCNAPGDLGRYLRQVGITHTTLTCFRRQRASGALDAPADRQSESQVEHSAASAKVSDKPASNQTRKVLELEREVRRLKQKLEQAEAIIDIQKKVSRLLESSLDRSES